MTYHRRWLYNVDKDHLGTVRKKQDHIDEISLVVEKNDIKSLLLLSNKLRKRTNFVQSMNVEVHS